MNLVARWDDKALCLETENAIELSRWHHVLASYDGSATAEGVQILCGWPSGESQSPAR